MGCKSEKKSEQTELGLFHGIPEKLQYSAISTGKILFERTHRQYQIAVERQQAAKAQKKSDQIKRKVATAKKGLKQVSLLHQQYKSPRCWTTKK